MNHVNEYMKTRFFSAAAGQHLQCGAIITCITPASGTGPWTSGRKLINEQMIYGDREKIENRDVLIASIHR